MSWRIIALSLGTFFDRQPAWSKRSVRIPDLETEKYDSSFYLAPRRPSMIKDYYLRVQAQENLASIRTRPEPDPYFVPSGSIPSPYQIVDLEEKIRIQNLLSGGL